MCIMLTYYFFIKALQRMNEYCGNFGSTALVMLNHFFDDPKAQHQFDTNEKRIEYSEKSLKLTSFLYENLNNPKVWSGLFYTI